MYSFTEENYLKAIYRLSADMKEGISTNSIAELLNTKAASVTDMLKKLAEKQLINYEKYKGVLLSEKGKKVAIQIIRKHRLWEVFLYEKLHFGWDEVHEIAEQLEHIHSPQLIDKLDDFLGNPTHDPHGDPIPTREGTFRKQKLLVLEDAPEGLLVMAGIRDHSPAFLRLLDKLGIGLGTRMEVSGRNEFDGSLELMINDEQSVHVSREVAKNILVSS